MTSSQDRIMNTYARFPVTLQKGSGIFVYDSEGKEYMDFGAGISVNNLGHCHPAVVAAIKKQAETMIHCSNLYWSEPQYDVAAYLTKYSGLDRVFFCNSGAEANEGAIKLARKYFYDKGEGDKYEIVTMRQSFHGRTLATLTATGQDKVKTGFAPLPAGFAYAPFNDIEALKAALTDHTCGVMLEPVQAEGGVYPADPGYLKTVADLCAERGLLLIFDEVQCGMGRCGTMFAFTQYGVTPDIMTTAKALGGGLPLGAVVAKEEVAASFGPGSHGSTFGANPVATAAAAAVFRAIEEEGILDNVQSVGAYFKAELEKLKEAFPGLVSAVRGKGLLLGLEVPGKAAGIINDCLEHGLLVLSAGPDVVRFLPPLTVTANDVTFALKIVKKALTSTGR